jgi:4-hydroxybutyrate dehydrogenase
MNFKAEVRFKNDYGKGEPTDAMVDALLEDFRQTDCNRIIAIGGGAVIDMAKILVLDGEAKAADYYQRKVPLKKVRTLIAVPTTCGAGSESSNISIAEILEMGTKFGLADNTIYPDYAVLIPTLLTELPYDFFATSAIDALIHAIESYVSPRANLYTRMFSEKAMEMILKGFQEIVENGPEYRFQLFDEFLTASDLAGIAFGNAGTGAVHAMSYPLSGAYHVTHGEANYQFLTEVFKHYQAGNPDGDIKVLNAFLADVMDCDADDVYVKIEELLGKIISKKPLREYGMKEEEIEAFAISVEKTQQRLLNQAYVKFDVTEMMDIYRTLY